MPYMTNPKDPEIEKIEEIKTVDDIVVYAFKQLAISQRNLDLKCIQQERDLTQFGDRVDDLRIQLEQKHKEAEELRTQSMKANFELGKATMQLYQIKHKKKAKK